MKRSFLIILLLSLVFPFIEAQPGASLWKMKRYEAVAGLGPSFFFGDIGGYSNTKNILGFKDLTFLQTRFDFNINLKYRITQDINARVSFTYGFLHAIDTRGSKHKRGFEASVSSAEPAIVGGVFFI